jgi:2-oxoglutarate ferredoxin oxidoreductase subunit alpha
MGALSFDLADRLQTPVIVLSDLDLGMNDNLSEPLQWDDSRRYDRGKVLSAAELDELSGRFGRYLDVDGDGICYRTYPGTHSAKGSFFTRGTSRDEYAVYTEDGEAYQRNMERLLGKWETAKSLVPAPEVHPAQKAVSDGVLFFGTSTASTLEALDLLRDENIHLDGLRIRGFPFSDAVLEFIDAHDRIFVIEQNRDGQLRKLLIGECDINPRKLSSLTYYAGMPITARYIRDAIRSGMGGGQVVPLRRQTAGVNP